MTVVLARCYNAESNRAFLLSFEPSFVFELMYFDLRCSNQDLCLHIFDSLLQSNSRASRGIKQSTSLSRTVLQTRFPLMLWLFGRFMYDHDQMKPFTMFGSHLEQQGLPFKVLLKTYVSSTIQSILPFAMQWGLCEYVIVHTILGGSPVILWISLGGKPKWLPLKFGCHDVMRTSPIGIVSILWPFCADQYHSFVSSLHD